MMGFKKTYFALSGLFPVEKLARLFNPFQLVEKVTIDNKPVQVFITQRARRALEARNSPLLMELQILFTCMVRKRVIFDSEAKGGVPVLEGKLLLVCRKTQADECSPEVFAEKFPVKKDLTTDAANRMLPKAVYLDYVRHQWEGSFVAG